MSTTIVDNSAQHIQQLNHNLRLEILSFLDTVEHRSLHNYGYFLSDPTRTIYRIHNFYPWISLEDEPIDSLSDHLLSKSKTITIYLHTELKKPIEQKLKRFAQRMPKQTIIIQRNIPFSIKDINMFMKQIENIYEPWPKNVKFSVFCSYYYNRLANTIEHRELFLRLKDVATCPLIHQIEICQLIIDSREPHVGRDYYDLLSSITPKQRQKFSCPISGIYITCTADWNNPDIQLFEQPDFWKLVVPTFSYQCQFTLNTPYSYCTKACVDAYLEHAFPICYRNEQRVEYNILEKVVQRPDLHKHLGDKVIVDDQSPTGVDLCKLIDMFAKVKSLNKIDYRGYFWHVSDFVTLEQKLHEAFAVRGTETKMHISCTDCNIKGSLYSLNDCELKDLVYTLVKQNK